MRVHASSSSSVGFAATNKPMNMQECSAAFLSIDIQFLRSANKPLSHVHNHLFLLLLSAFSWPEASDPARPPTPVTPMSPCLPRSLSDSGTRHRLDFVSLVCVTLNQLFSFVRRLEEAHLGDNGAARALLRGQWRAVRIRVAIKHVVCQRPLPRYIHFIPESDSLKNEL